MLELIYHLVVTNQKEKKMKTLKRITVLCIILITTLFVTSCSFLFPDPVTRIDIFNEYGGLAGTLELEALAASSEFTGELFERFGVSITPPYPVYSVPEQYRDISSFDLIATTIALQGANVLGYEVSVELDDSILEIEVTPEY